MRRVLTQRQIDRNRRRIAIGIAVALTLFVAIIVWTNVTKAVMQDEGALSLQDSIMESSNQCYSIEGAYPPSLEYLEQQYGLMIDHEDYAVTYEIYAENIAPNVTVVPR